MLDRKLNIWVKYAAPVFMLMYLLIGVVLAVIRHNSFHTDLLDLGYFTHIVWNTSQGRLFNNYIPPNPPISLADHFAPALLLVAPLFWIVPDARALQFADVLCLTLAMIPVYLIVREKQPVLAPFVVLALALNPMGSQVSASEFHEIMLATPVLAFALYALYKRNTKLLIGMLALALLVREDMGLIVACFGVYLLLLCKGQRRVGAVALVSGIVWSLAITQIVMPMFGMQYRHLNVFIGMGNSLSEVALSLLKNLPDEIAGLFTLQRFGVYLKLFLPFLFLPLIAAGEQILWLPAMLLIMITPSDINEFTRWHIAAFLGLLWVSVAIVIARTRASWVKWVTGGLVMASLAGYFIWGWYPGGLKYNPAHYVYDQHAAIGQSILAHIPANTPIAAQSRLAAHLVTRKQIAMFPWLDQTWTPAMILLDEKDPNPYPMTPDRLKKFVQEYESYPTYKIALEQDGYFIFKPGAQTIKPLAQPLKWGNQFSLEEVQVSQEDTNLRYRPLNMADETVEPGRSMRVDLYMVALTQMNINYTISVRLTAPDGRVVAQDDSWPARGLLSTLQWPQGQHIRDVHYLHIPDGPLPDMLKLQVVVYNSDTQERLDPKDGYDITDLESNN